MSSSPIDDERVLRVLENAIDWMESQDNQERMDEYDHIGFDAAAVEAGGWEFKQLMRAGLIEQVYNSNSSSYYRIPDLEEAKKAVSVEQSPDQIIQEARDIKDVSPDELFTDIVGRDKPKKWLRRTIDRGEQVHHLLHGPPGSGKSMIADDIARLPGAERVVLSGDSTTAVGIRDTLLENPSYLVVEEIEKGAKSDREALMTACGEGYVKVTKSGVDKQVETDTIVIATSNDITAITPESLVDRFMQWEFDQYGHEEFGDVCTEVLPRDHSVSTSLARYIADTVFNTLESTQVREAKRIAALADDESEVDELADSLSNTS